MTPAANLVFLLALAVNGVSSLSGSSLKDGAHHHSRREHTQRLISKLAGRSYEVQKTVGGDVMLKQRHTHPQVPRATAPFAEWLRTVPWKALPHDHGTWKGRISSLEKQLLPYLYMEPLVEKNGSARPPELVGIPEGCGQHKDIFKHARREPAVLIDMFHFGYEADILEIRLHEYADVADLFIMVEPEISFWGVRRTVSWDHLRRQKRFQPFSKKVLHLVLTKQDYDDFHPIPRVGGNLTFDDTVYTRDERFAIEGKTQMLESGYLPATLQKLGLRDESVVLNFGDVDEVTSRRNMHLMKHCEPWNLPVDSAIWNPMGKIDRAVKTPHSHPAASHPSIGKGFVCKDGITPLLCWTYADPTFQSASHFIGHGRGSNDFYLLGGMHMTSYAYLPFWIAKSISTSDSKGIPEDCIAHLQRGNVSKVIDDLIKMRAPCYLGGDMLSAVSLDELYNISPLYRDMVYIPWFLAANSKRFPLWSGGADARLFTVPTAQRTAALSEMSARKSNLLQIGVRKAKSTRAKSKVPATWREAQGTDGAGRAIHSSTKKHFDSTLLRRESVPSQPN